MASSCGFCPRYESRHERDCCLCESIWDRALPQIMTLPPALEMLQLVLISLHQFHSGCGEARTLPNFNWWIVTWTVFFLLILIFWLPLFSSLHLGQQHKQHHCPILDWLIFVEIDLLAKLGNSHRINGFAMIDRKYDVLPRQREEGENRKHWRQEKFSCRKSTINVWSGKVKEVS